MLAATQSTRRFTRRTQLDLDEYRKNFKQLDEDAIAVVSSKEADKVTQSMSKIYLRLVNAPRKYIENEGVLRFEGELREGKNATAWTVLCELVGVSSATANKAIHWMHQQGVIGYFAGKNGVGIRIFLNRAVASIGVRQPPAAKKILAFAPASSNDAPASRNEPAFKDSFAVSDNSDTDVNPGAPKNGTPEQKTVGEANTSERPAPMPAPPTPAPVRPVPTKVVSTASPGERAEPPAMKESVNALFVSERIVRELEPRIKAACALEHERTRQWFEKHALPKAIRVSQRSAYDVLRAHGLVKPLSRGDSRDVGRASTGVVTQGSGGARAVRLTDEEVAIYAQSCIALLSAQGQSIERTLSEMCVAAGGFMLPDDLPRVRERVRALMESGERREQWGRESLTPYQGDYTVMDSD